MASSAFSIAQLPQFVIDDIVQFASPYFEYDPMVYAKNRPTAAALKLRWVCVDLALVAPRWAAAVRDSETVPPLLADVCSLRLPRSMKHAGFMTMPELRRRVEVRARLRPLPAGLLLPIEDCARADCPRYCDALTSAELMEPLAPPASEQLRRRRQFYCGKCSKVVPIRATRRQARSTDQPHAIVQTRARTQFLRRPRNRPTYGIAVIDCDGVSAIAMLRTLRALMFVFDANSVPASEVGELPDASSACFTPSFRLEAGSCAHQYEFYPVTIAGDAGWEVPATHPARTLHPTMQLLFYGAIVSLTPERITAGVMAEMRQAARRDLVSQAWRQPILQIIDPIDDDGVAHADQPLNVDARGAMRILRVLESGCGSESDSDSGGRTSADTPGGRSRSPLSTDDSDIGQLSRSDDDEDDDDSTSSSTSP